MVEYLGEPEVPRGDLDLSKIIKIFGIYDLFIFVFLPVPGWNSEIKQQNFIMSFTRPNSC